MSLQMFLYATDGFWARKRPSTTLQYAVFYKAKRRILQNRKS